MFFGLLAPIFILLSEIFLLFTSQTHFHDAVKETATLWYIVSPCYQVEV